MYFGRWMCSAIRFQWLKPFLSSVGVSLVAVHLYLSYDFNSSWRKEFLDSDYEAANRCHYLPATPGGYVFDIGKDPDFCRYFKYKMNFVLEVNLSYPHMVPVFEDGKRDDLIRVYFYPSRPEKRLRSIEPFGLVVSLPGGDKFLNVRGERVESFRGSDGALVSVNYRHGRRFIYRMYRGLQVVYEVGGVMAKLEDVDVLVVSFLGRAVK